VNRILNCFLLFQFVFNALMFVVIYKAVKKVMGKVRVYGSDE
jgi:hypothetical protein